MADQSIGEIIDGLQVFQPGEMDGFLPVSAVVMLGVLNVETGDVGFRVSWNESMSWLERRGMLEVALDAEREVNTSYAEMMVDCDDDDGYDDGE